MALELRSDWWVGGDHRGIWRKAVHAEWRASGKYLGQNEPDVLDEKTIRVAGGQLARGSGTQVMSKKFAKVDRAQDMQAKWRVSLCGPSERFADHSQRKGKSWRVSCREVTLYVTNLKQRTLVCSRRFLFFCLCFYGFFFFLNKIGVYYT